METLEVVTELWTGEPLHFDGKFYTVEEAVLPYTPVQVPRIPLLLGCWWPNKKPVQRAPEWNRIMPAAPAFYGSEGKQCEPVTGTIEEEARKLVEYYRNLTDEPKEILLPVDTFGAPDDFAGTCGTWERPGC